MKARVKATGDIIEVERIGIASDIWALQSDSTVVFDDEELDINIEPDYWEKLKHQAAIDFMKSFLGKYDGTVNIESLLRNAIKLATALVNKLKEES